MSDNPTLITFTAEQIRAKLEQLNADRLAWTALGCWAVIRALMDEQIEISASVYDSDPASPRSSGWTCGPEPASPRHTG